MRIILALVSLTVSGLSYAGPLGADAMRFHFDGDWRNDRGESGTWTSEMTLTTGEATPPTIKVNKTLAVQTEQGTVSSVSEFLLVETASGFFNVQSRNKKIGEGYCFDLQCHYSIGNEDGVIEESWTMRDNKIYQVGSQKTLDGTEIWKGVGIQVRSE